MSREVPRKKLFFSQEYYGHVQSLEAAANDRGKIVVLHGGIQDRFRESAQLGVDHRAPSEFVEQVRAVGMDGEGGMSASAVVTPAMLEGVIYRGEGRAEEADPSVMRAAPLLGRYHAWNMESKYPLPGSMLVDDMRRRFQAMYASEEERALVVTRGEREKALEVSLAVVDRLEEHRLPTAVESLLQRLETTVREKDEAVAANIHATRLAPASHEDLEVFEWMEADPPHLMDIEGHFSKGLVSVTAVHPQLLSTGLMRACKLGLLTVVRLYLKHGADASFANEGGTSCLHFAWEKYMTFFSHAIVSQESQKVAYLTLKDMVSELLEYGADPNKCGANGVTPLHVAAGYGHDDICGLLLRHGADRGARQFQGLTPLQLAQRECSNALALTPLEMARREGKTSPTPLEMARFEDRLKQRRRDLKGCCQIIANWGHIEKAYKMEEWNTEWRRVLKDNAETLRKNVAGTRGWAERTTGTGSPETAKRAQEALWGSLDDPKRNAALLDTTALLKGHKVREDLAAYRASLKPSVAAVAAATEGGSGATTTTSSTALDPRLKALTLPTAEYDMTQDALRVVDVVADSKGAGETKRLRLLEALVEGKGTSEEASMPWGRRPPPKLTIAEKEHALALEEEDKGVVEAERRGEEARDAMLMNAGEGEGALLLKKQASLGKGKIGVGGKSSKWQAATGPVGLPPVIPPGRALNLVAQDEVSTQLTRVFGSDGEGAYRTPALLQEIRALKEAAEAAEAASAQRKAELAEQKAAEETRRAILLGKKSKGGGQWVKNRFGKFNFVLDDVKEEVGDKQRRLEAEERKKSRAEYEDATKRARELGWGEKRVTALLMAEEKKETVKQVELAMDEDDYLALEEKREKEFMMKWYLGENRAPPSDGSTLEARRRFAGVSVRADAPTFLPSHTTLLPAPGTGGKEQVVLTRRPAQLSTLLRPARLRVDNRATVDAGRVVASGQAFDALVQGEDLFTQPLPPDNTGLLAPTGDSESVSRVGAGSLKDAAMSYVEREEAGEPLEDALVTAAIRERTQRSLTGRGLTVPVRQGFGELAANDVALLPYASSKRIAAESASFTTAGVSKADIAAAAQVAYERMMGGREAESLGKGRGGRRKGGAPTEQDAATAAALRNADLQRVRNTVSMGMVTLAEEFEAVNALHKDHNAHARGEVDYTDFIPLGTLRTDVDGGRAPRLGDNPYPGKTKAQADAFVAREKARVAAEKEEEDRVRRAREMGQEKPQVPRIGFGSLAAWPLHAPGPLVTDMDAVGGGRMGAASSGGGEAAMVYRHYSVLDSVAESKAAAREERIRVAERVMQEEVERRIARANKKGGKKGGGGVGSSTASPALPPAIAVPLARKGLAEASRSRAAAIEKQKEAEGTMQSMSKLMMSRGHARAPAPIDAAVPLLSGAALETEDFVKRVKPDREYVVREAMVNKGKGVDLGRDRVLDVYQGVKSPWEAAPALIDFNHIAGKKDVL